MRIICLLVPDLPCQLTSQTFLFLPVLESGPRRGYGTGNVCSDCRQWFLGLLQKYLHLSFVLSFFLCSSIHAENHVVPAPGVLGGRALEGRLWQDWHGGQNFQTCPPKVWYIRGGGLQSMILQINSLEGKPPSLLCCSSVTDVFTSVQICWIVQVSVSVQAEAQSFSFLSVKHRTAGPAVMNALITLNSWPSFTQLEFRWPLVHCDPGMSGKGIQF